MQLSGQLLRRKKIINKFIIAFYIWFIEIDIDLPEELLLTSNKTVLQSLFTSDADFRTDTTAATALENNANPMPIVAPSHSHELIKFVSINVIGSVTRAHIPIFLSRKQSNMNGSICAWRLFVRRMADDPMVCGQTGHKQTNDDTISDKSNKDENSTLNHFIYVLDSARKSFCRQKKKNEEEQKWWIHCKNTESQNNRTLLSLRQSNEKIYTWFTFVLLTYQNISFTYRKMESIQTK